MNRLDSLSVQAENGCDLRQKMSHFIKVCDQKCSFLCLLQLEVPHRDSHPLCIVPHRGAFGVHPTPKVILDAFIGKNDPKIDFLVFFSKNVRFWSENPNPSGKSQY